MLYLNEQDNDTIHVTESSSQCCLAVKQTGDCIPNLSNCTCCGEEESKPSQPTGLNTNVSNSTKMTALPSGHKELNRNFFPSDDLNGS